MLNVLAPSINAPRLQLPIDETELTSSLAIGLLNILCRADKELISFFSMFAELKEVRGITKPDGLDEFFSQSAGREMERFQELLCLTFSSPSEPQVSRSSECEKTTGSSLRISVDSEVCELRKIPSTRLSYVESSKKGDVISLATDISFILEALIRVILGMNHNDCEAFCRKVEKVAKGKKRAEASPRLSTSILQFLASGRVEIKCLVGSGVPRCLRMLLLLRQLIEINGGVETAKVDHPHVAREQNTRSDCRSGYSSQIFYDLGVAITTIGLGILADDMKSLETRLSSIDGLYIMIDIPNFNSDVLLLGVQKAFLTGSSDQLGHEVGEGYTTFSGKRKKPPGFRSSTGVAASGSNEQFKLQANNSENGLEPGSRWFPVLSCPTPSNDLIFDYCTYCKLQVRRTVPNTGSDSRSLTTPTAVIRSRIQQSSNCSGCGKSLKSVKDMSIQNPPSNGPNIPHLSFSSRSDHFDEMGVKEGGAHPFNSSNGRSDAEGLSVATLSVVPSSAKMEQRDLECILEYSSFQNIPSGESLIIQPTSSRSSAQSTSAVLEIEQKALSTCSWVRPSLSECVSHTVDNLENKESIIQQMIRNHLTVDLIERVMHPPLSFSLPVWMKTPDVTQSDQSSNHNQTSVTTSVFYPPGFSATKPFPDSIPWKLPRHGWILRLLDDLQDSQIRINILAFLGQLFVTRPAEYRTWHVRFVSHIPILAAIFDDCPDVVRAALKTIIRSSRLAPLKDGAIKKLVRLIELEDFPLRLHIICDVFCRCKYTDNKSIKILIRGIMTGNSLNRSQFQKDWSSLFSPNIVIEMSATGIPSDIEARAIDDVDFRLNWNAFGGNDRMELSPSVLWLSISARCCFTIGSGHPKLLENLSSILPEASLKSKDGSDGTNGSPADVAAEVIGVVAFMLGAGLNSWEEGKTVKGWRIEVKELSLRKVVLLRPPVNNPQYSNGLTRPFEF